MKLLITLVLSIITCDALEYGKFSPLGNQIRRRTVAKINENISNLTEFSFNYSWNNPEANVTVDNMKIFLVENEGIEYNTGDIANVAYSFNISNFMLHGSFKNKLEEKELEAKFTARLKDDFTMDVLTSYDSRNNQTFGTHVGLSVDSKVYTYNIEWKEPEKYSLEDKSTVTKNVFDDFLPYSFLFEMEFRMNRILENLKID